MKTLDEMIAVMQAARDGKAIEWNTREGLSTCWARVSDWVDYWNWERYDYRIKPEPKRVPLGPEDVPPGSALRHKNINGWSAVQGLKMVGNECVGVAVPDHCGWKIIEFANLMEMEISRDGGKTWQPCWREQS